MSKQAILCAALAVAIVQMPTHSMAQSALPLDWTRHGFVVDGKVSCAFAKQASANFPIIVAGMPGSGEIELYFKDTAWTLTTGETYPVKVGFDTYAYEFDTVAETASTVRFVFDAENGDGITDVLGWSEILHVESGNEQHDINLSTFDDMMEQLLLCMDIQAVIAAQASEASVKPSLSQKLQSGLAELAEVPLAAYICDISMDGLVGIVSPGGTDHARATEIMLYPDGSLRVQGIKVAPREIQYDPADPSVIATVAYDAPSVLKAIQGTAVIPPIYGEDRNTFTQAMEAYNQLGSDAMFAGRQRIVAIAPGADIIAFTDIDENGELVNMNRPTCYRTR